MNDRPIEKNITLYKGTTFLIEFYAQAKGQKMDVSTWQWDFRAVKYPGDTPKILEASTTGVTPKITIDVHDPSLVRIEFSETDTAAISATGALVFEIDTINDEGQTIRYMKGLLNLVEAV